MTADGACAHPHAVDVAVECSVGVCRHVAVAAEEHDDDQHQLGERAEVSGQGRSPRRTAHRQSVGPVGGQNLEQHIEQGHLVRPARTLRRRCAWRGLVSACAGAADGAYAGHELALWAKERTDFRKMCFCSAHVTAMNATSRYGMCLVR